MARGKTICNLCGKEFDIYDEQESIGYHDRPGYGSSFDGIEIDLDLCLECFDKLMTELIPRCKINPISYEK